MNSQGGCQPFLYSTAHRNERTGQRLIRKLKGDLRKLYETNLRKLNGCLPKLTLFFGCFSVEAKVILGNFKFFSETNPQKLYGFLQKLMFGNYEEQHQTYVAVCSKEFV